MHVINVLLLLVRQFAVQRHAMYHAAQHEECLYVKCDIFTMPRFKTIYDVEITYSQCLLVPVKHLRGFRHETGWSLLRSL